MGHKIKRLGDAELEIMRVIWAEPEPVTSSQVHANLHSRSHWQLSTLMTVLTRLEKKGFLNCDRSTRTNYYRAVISEREYQAKEGSSFFQKLYGSSINNLVLSLYDSEAIDDADLSELRTMIDDLTGGKADV